MKNISFITGLLCILALFSAGCGKTKESIDAVITERIQYDVPIKSPDPEFDWWVQNIEGAKRESLVKNILSSVTEGNVKAYDYSSNRLLTKEEAGKIIKHSDTVAIERADPPHELVDTVLVKEISARDITRIRFLEEWKMDPKTLAFTKRVVGICPLLEVYSDSGELRGYKPLFWVFTDEAYPAKLK